jgi:transcriptional regulator with XRE-family HTH domain
MEIAQANAVIGANLRGLRGKNDYSREKLSELSGVPVITIRRIEDGERAASTPTLIALVRALNTTVSEFFDGIEAELDKISNA